MARQTKPLSVKEIESAKPKEADYVLYDGDVTCSPLINTPRC